MHAIVYTQFGFLTLFLMLSIAWGLPIVAMTGQQTSAFLFLTPAFGSALLTIVVTLAYAHGFASQTIAFSTVAIALVFSIMFIAIIIRVARFISSQKLTSLVYFLCLLIIISPLFTNRLQFTLFQANLGDTTNYMTAAVVDSKLIYTDIINSSTAEDLKNPLLTVTKLIFYARPSVNILYGVVGSLIPGSIFAGSYAFLSAFGVIALLSFAGVLHLLFQSSDRREALLVSICSGTYACGFWGQYPIDINAWSQVAATPLLIASWGLIILLLDNRSDQTLSHLRLIILSLSLLLAGAIYLYPESSLFNLLIIVGVLIVSGRPRVARQGLVVIAILISICVSMLFWRSTLGFAVGPSQYAVVARDQNWRHFDAYAFGMDMSENFHLQNLFSQGIAQLPHRFILLPTHVINYFFGQQGLIATLTTMSGVFGVYFLTPSTYSGLVFWDVLKVSLLICVLAGMFIGTVRAWREQDVNYRLICKAALFGLLGASILLEQGSAWPAGKALSYASPLICLTLLRPALIQHFRPSWLRWTPVPWGIAQSCFVIMCLTGLTNVDGQRLPAPYPPPGLLPEKQNINWDIETELNSLRNCPAVQIVASSPYFRQFASIALFEENKPYFYTDEVQTAPGMADHLGFMPVIDVRPECRLEQHVPQR